MNRACPSKSRNTFTRILKISKETSWIASGQLITVLGGLLLVRILTEYLPSSEYGRLALALTIAGLVNRVVMGSISNGISRFYSIAVEKGDLPGYFRACKRLMGNATLIVVVIIVVAIFSLIMNENFQWLSLVISVLIFSIIDGWNSTMSSVLNAARKRPIVALNASIGAWLKIGFVVVIIHELGPSSSSVVTGYAISALLITGSLSFFLMRLFRQHITIDHSKTPENWGKQIWLFSYPFSVWGLFIWAQQASDRWALETFSGIQSVGQYAVVFQLGYVPIGMITTLMISLLAPIFYQKSGDATVFSRNLVVSRLIWRTTWLSLGATLLGFVFTWLFHKWLFKILVAEAYYDVSLYLPWMVLAGGLFATGQMLSLRPMSELRSNTLLAVKIGTALLGITINLFGAWMYGITGVVVGMVIFSIAHLLGLIYITNRVLPDEVLTRDPI